MRQVRTALRTFVLGTIAFCGTGGAGIVRADNPSDADLLPKLSSREQKLRDDRLHVIQKGSSGKTARLAALDKLPLDRLAAPQRERAQAVLDNISLFRDLPTVSFEAEPEVYRFFLNAPEVAVGIWKAMGISKFRMTQRTATEYEADCGYGTSGVIEVLYRDDERLLVHCDGAFKSPLMRKAIRSKCLLSLDWSFTRDRDGRPFVKHHAAMFVSFPSQTVETAARAVSPISSQITDHNFREISLFVHMMSLAMRRQPGWVERTAVKMDDVIDSRKQQLLKLTAQVYVANRKHEVRAQGDDVSLDDVLIPAGR